MSGFFDDNDDDEMDFFGMEPLGGIDDEDIAELKRLAESGNSPMKFIERLEKKGIKIPKMLKMFAQRNDFDLEHVDFLNDDEVKLYNDFHTLTKEAEELMNKLNKKIKVKRELFWAHIKDRLDLFDENEISIDPLTQSIQKRVKKDK